MKYYQSRTIFCYLLICVLVLTSCSNTGFPYGDLSESAPVLGKDLDEEKNVKLTVLTERFLWSQPPFAMETKGADKGNLLDNLSQICDYYEHEHPNVKIELEIIPASQETRETTIQRRRVELLAGKTPDIYLLPTMSCDFLYTSKDYPLLFNDVQQAMTNNWFADINAYYETDEALQTDELQSKVMDAGVMNGKRYVLPLGYSFGTIVADKEELNRTELASALQSQGIQGYMNACLNDGCLKWALERGNSLNWFLNYFPSVCDYQKEMVYLQEEEVSSAMQLHTRFWKQGMEYFSGKEIVVSSSIDDYLHGSKEFYLNTLTPVAFEPIETLIETLGIAKAYEKEIEVLPLRAADGGVVADVTFWGAISPNCQNIDYAYDFLRIFLSPEVQHGDPLIDSDMTRYSTSFSAELNPGWPVRNHGYLQKRWDYIKGNLALSEGASKRESKLAEVQLDDDDFSVLDEEIAQVRFPSYLDRLINQTFFPALYSDTTEEEISKLATSFIREMKYRLAEG